MKMHIKQINNKDNQINSLKLLHDYLAKQFTMYHESLSKYESKQTLLITIQFFLISLQSTFLTIFFKIPLSANNKSIIIFSYIVSLLFFGISIICLLILLYLFIIHLLFTKLPFPSVSDKIPELLDFDNIDIEEIYKNLSLNYFDAIKMQDNFDIRRKKHIMFFKIVLFCCILSTFLSFLGLLISYLESKNIISYILQFIMKLFL